MANNYQKGYSTCVDYLVIEILPKRLFVNKRLSRVCDGTLTISGIMLGFIPHAPLLWDGALHETNAPYVI
ncbi:MAG: hypothetical protein F6K17_09360 [Okeania sp. SIO3C4]|nr:hypothetical protein [Okeania sp. SIO3C4]